MSSWDNRADRIAIAQMNSELQHAQLELLSAHCAVHQLRLRFTSDDLARFGQRDILRKSVETAASLSDYYQSIEKKIPDVDAELAAVPEGKIAEAISQLSAHLAEQRDRYFASAAPLTNKQRAIMWPYFSPSLLNRVRVVELVGERVPNPPFYQEARAFGFDSLPEWTHMNSITLIDVLVFNEKITNRTLFHALVHAVQFEVLGLERYCERFIRSFVNTRLHFSVPLEAHTFALEAKFAENPADRFFVEDRVRSWVKQERY